MMKFLVVLILTLLTGCAAKQSRVSKDWKRYSDKISKSFADSLAALGPEEYSILGLSKWDSEVTSFSKSYDQINYALAYKWHEKFVRFLEAEKNPELITDINILKETARLKMEEFELAKEAGVVPFLPITQFIHNNLQFFLAPQAPLPKKASAMSRFRKYVRGSDSVLPIVDGYTSFMLSRMEYLAENKKRGFWPTKAELDNYFENSDKYLAGIEKFLSTWTTDDWKRDFEQLKLQDAEFRKFLMKKVYPYARTSNVMPEKVYAYKLKTNGIYYPPRQLIETATQDYKKTYIEFRKMAQIVAKSYGLKDSSPASVVYFLRQRRAEDDDHLLSMYKTTADILFDLIREKKLLTLNKRPEYILRFASPIEAEVTPSPQFIASPWLTKTKIPAQFILPRVKDTKGMDDYNYSEAVYTLTAHEAIPGHALQFERVLESGTTLARGHFAYNNANIEGWGLYSEDIIYPHVNDEIKLIFLQRLLWRQARMFLDPQLNLGLISPSRVIELYTQELGFSHGLALSELRRYSYIAPAQAPSYYFGMKMILDTKKKVKEKPDMIFDERCFNDAVLNSGILPLKVISDRLVKDLSCVP